MKIELLSVVGCPNVEPTRALLEACLLDARVRATVEERVGAYPSPSVLIDGTDVMGQPEAQGAMCRLDLPTRERILSALRA